MTMHGIEVPLERIAAFCRVNGVRRLALFGSAIHGDFRPESDLDLLVEFEPGRRVGLAFIRLQDDLSRLLGRTVDLHTPASLSRHFRAAVLSEAETLYVAA